LAITLVVADDHPLILDGLAGIFQLEEDFTVLGRCETGEEALEAVRKHKPDILVLDIRMPGQDGFDVLREMSKEKLATQVVVLTAALDETEVLDAIRLGVRGVVLKEMAPRLLVQCIRTVHAGGQWLERQSTTRAIEKILRLEAGMRRVAAALTAREIEIVRAVGAGFRNKEIAEKLSISEGTVKVHLHNIYEKLNMDGRMALMVYARDNALA
jgi:DNA-binding NarL/FixJ family response regulator